MTDTSKKIVDAIHNGEMNDARDLVFQGMKEKDRRSCRYEKSRNCN